MDLAGKRAIVTGGVSGLGRRMVEDLVEASASVTVFDIDRPGLTELVGEISGVTGVECDVSQYDQVAAATAEYHEQVGSADILINNAGVLYSAPLVRLGSSGIETHDVEMWEQILSADLSSVFYMTTCVAGQMIATRTRGVIVNISSVAAAGNPGQSAYSAAKAGVNALTAVWAQELGPLGLRVAAVAPGFADTASTDAALGDGALRETIRKVPLRRLGAPADIADSVMYVLRNDFFNGKVLAVDGGLVL